MAQAEPFPITDPHAAAEAADKLAAHDDVLKQIDDIRTRLNHLTGTAELYLNKHLFDLYAAVFLAVGDTHNPLEDLESDVRHDRKQIDDALKEWESVEAYGEPAVATAGGAA